MILILNLSARFTLLNPQKESKQKSDHIVTCSTLLNISYDRIANFDLVILPFKYVSTLLNIFIVSFILYSWKEASNYHKETLKKQGKKHWKKEEGNFLKKSCEGNCQKNEKGNIAKKEEGNIFIKNGKETLKKQGKKYWKREERNFS